MSRRNERGYLRTGAAGALAASVVACGGSGGGDPGWNGVGFEGGLPADENGAVLVGIAGVTYAVTSTTLKDNVVTTETTTGTTPESGALDVASVATCTTTKDATGTATTSCTYSGYTAPDLNIGGQPLPPLPTPVTGQYITRYALSDFGAAAFNVAKFILMGNSNPGNPLINGIRLSSGFSTTDCPQFDWATTNIEQDAACFLTQADKDNVQHAWPSDDTVNQFLQQNWLNVHRGYYVGWQSNSKTTAYPQQLTLGGNFVAIVDADGTTAGLFDFLRFTQTYTLPSVAWSGVLVPPVSGQSDGSLTYVTSATAPIPDLTVSFAVNANGGTMTYRSADGTLAGGSGAPDTPGGMQEWGSFDIPLPKYHFLLKSVAFTPPGESTPRNFVLNIEIGYGGYAYLEIDQYPPRSYGGRGESYGMYGQLNPDNTVSLHWYDLKSDGYGSPAGVGSTLTLDPTTLTLSGNLNDYNGLPWKTITTQGWRT